MKFDCCYKFLATEVTGHFICHKQSRTGQTGVTVLVHTTYMWYCRWSV